MNEKQQFSNYHPFYNKIPHFFFNHEQRRKHEFHEFHEKIKKLLGNHTKRQKKLRKNQKISNEFNKIINEEYKTAQINDQKQFLALYKRNYDEFQIDEFFNEGKVEQSEVPSFVLNQIFHFSVGFLFFLKFLKNTLN